MAHAVNKKLSRTKRAKKFEGMLAITKQLTELEHVSTELNRGDSQESVDARV